MRDFEVRPTLHVSGTISVPGDKSISHRALMLSGLADGTSEVTGFLAGEDCLATLHAMRALGVRIEQPGATHVIIHGSGLHGLKGARRALDMGNAGTAMRLFTGLLAAQRFPSTLIGDASLMKRPMERVAKPLREMGADVRTHDGKPPVEISGARRLRGIDYTMPVASAKAGYIASLQCEWIGTACVILGGGRERKEDSVDPAVGIVVHKKIGDKVSAGEALCTMHCHSDAQAARAQALLEESYEIASAPPAHKAPLVHRVIYKGEH